MIELKDDIVEEDFKESESEMLNYLIKELKKKPKEMEEILRGWIDHCRYEDYIRGLYQRTESVFYICTHCDRVLTSCRVGADDRKGWTGDIFIHSGGYRQFPKGGFKGAETEFIPGWKRHAICPKCKKKTKASIVALKSVGYKLEWAVERKGDELNSEEFRALKDLNMEQVKEKYKK